MNTELIQQLAATSTEARQILEKEYPNEFRKSGWYVDSEIPRWLGFRDYENNRHYGFDALGCWYDYKEAQSELTSSESLAPLDIVQKRLIEEAKRRGYKKGNFKGLSANPYESFVDFDNWTFLCNKLFSASVNCGGYVIFDNGRWAEIVKEPETDTKIDLAKYIVDSLIKTLIELRESLNAK